jgi:hypothetical protein
MLNAITHGRVPGVDTDQRRLVYLVSSTDAMYAAEQACVFTDGNAAVFGLTEFDDNPANLATHVDWAIMREQYWANTPEDNDRRRRRIAEFLVYEQVPIGLFTEIGVYDAPMKTALEDAIDGDWAVPVNVRRSWYF